MARCLECGRSDRLQLELVRFGCLLLILVLAVAGCGISPSKPNPNPMATAPDQAAAALAAGLSAKDLSPLPFVGASGAAVNDLFQPLVAGMGPVKPNVTVASVSRDGSSATAKLVFHLDLSRRSGAVDVPDRGQAGQGVRTVEDKLAAEHRAASTRRHEPTVAAAPPSRAR